MIKIECEGNPQNSEIPISPRAIDKLTFNNPSKGEEKILIGSFFPIR